jgi:muconate cycloisomerase
VKISRLECTAIDMPVRPEVAIVGARGGHLTSPFAILRVHTDEGIVGLGEVSCTPGWSGEDHVTACHLIRTYLEPVLVGSDPFDIGRLATLMASRLANNPFTRAGVEMALWDILGRAANLPLYQLWGGGHRDSVPTKFSVSGREPKEAARIASWAVEQGFTAMKVKVGGDLRADVARVEAVREAVGPDTLLGVDANGGWSPWVAAQAVDRLSDFDIAFVEQPLARGRIGAMAAVRGRTSIPILADESVETSLDALDLIRADAVDAVSIYVGKGAGLSMAREIMALAAAAGLGATIGSNGELGIATAAMTHLGMVLPKGAPESLPCDILSVFMYEDMLVREPLDIVAGRATPSSAPGLGVEVDEERLQHYRVN